MTPRQSELYRFLLAAAADRRSPSFDEMGLALGYRSKSPVHKLIVGLERQGLIVRDASRARTVRVVSDEYSRGLRDGYELARLGKPLPALSPVPAPQHVAEALLGVSSLTSAAGVSSAAALREG